MNTMKHLSASKKKSTKPKSKKSSKPTPAQKSKKINLKSIKKSKVDKKSKPTDRKSSTKSTSKSSTKFQNDDELSSMGIVVVDDALDYDKDTELEERRAYLEESRSQDTSD